MRGFGEPQYALLAELRVVLKDAAAPCMVVACAVENRRADENVAGGERLQSRALLHQIILPSRSDSERLRAQSCSVRAANSRSTTRQAASRRLPRETAHSARARHTAHRTKTE